MKSNIRRILPDQRTVLDGPPDSPFRREQYVGDDNVWIGEVMTEPGGATPWHHHGEHTTYAYLLEGEATVEFGAAGGERTVLQAGGGLGVVPPHLIHREINTGSAPNRILIMRVGEGPPVIPASGPASD